MPSVGTIGRRDNTTQTHVLTHALNQAFLASQAQFKTTEPFIVERSSSQVQEPESQFGASPNAAPKNKVVGAHIEVAFG